MSRLLLCGDTHLGHRNIHKYRSCFSSAEEHDAVIFDNLASTVNKRDVLYLLGDIAFTKEAWDLIGTIKCERKVLILGNHDTERVHMSYILQHVDHVHSMLSKNGTWFSHCPIHEAEMRGKLFNVHGHMHSQQIMLGDQPHPRYFCTSVEHTNFKPITFQEVSAIMLERRLLNQLPEA
jgi:calcineurin-like phosphoesterase family protein